ncbi:hypothetical protein FGO68_gene2198 [Halteria grandinella]|uniref:Zinc finger PHD-type domain-containing protein n=1 Tax=Halteria grandinella TaxID=5974 RepID=A0A8J8T481_HALGN|nr:hypothetical protein FGO68_gene2198 [Halteria grandinella]
MMHELDRHCKRIGEEVEALKKDLLKKRPSETPVEEAERIVRQKNRLNEMYEEVDSLSQEKLKIVEKLFCMQQNFVRKLDQEIEKTEEDKYVQEQCAKDQQNEDPSEPGNFSHSRQKFPKKQGAREIGASLASYSGRQTGVSGSLAREFSIGGIGAKGDYNHSSSLMGSLDPLMQPGKSKKGAGADIFDYGRKDLMLDSSFQQPGLSTSASMRNRRMDAAKKDTISTIGKKSSRVTTQKGNRKGHQLGAFDGGRQGVQQYSQDQITDLGDGVNVEEEDQCKWCFKRTQECDWVSCDNCDQWYHYSCMDITGPLNEATYFKCKVCDGQIPPERERDVDIKPINLMDGDE